MEIITCHENADFDTFSSMIGVKKLYPKAKIVFSGSIEHTLKNAMADLKLGVKITPLKEIDLEKVTKIILVDVNSASRIGPFKSIVNNVEVHVFDHHIDEPTGLKLTKSIIKKAGSTATIITEILKKKSLKISGTEATILMAGIYEDTGFLTFQTTTKKDFEMAGYLFEKGADLSLVSKFLKDTLTRDEARYLSVFIDNEETFLISGQNIVITSAHIKEFSGDLPLLAQRIMEIEGMASLALLAHKRDRVHVIMRSRTSEVDVGIVARSLGGGGHTSASSVTLKNKSLIEAKEEVIKSFTDNLHPRIFAKDIMSSPVKTIDENDTIKKTYDTMVKFNINSMPVMKGKNAVGLATKQVCDKALYHGLKNVAIKNYMATDIKTVKENSSIEEIKNILTGLGQRLVPVMKKNNLAGVVSRKDLLKTLRSDFTDLYLPTSKKKKNLSKAIETELPPFANSLLKDLGATADKLGYKSYCVGGFVRDLILKRENLDIDIVVEGDGINFARQFAKTQKIKVKVKAHEKFRAAKIIFDKDFPVPNFTIDVATARLEYYEKPGTLPTIELSSLKLDLYRRDFTINTLAISLNKKTYGNLIDFFAGTQDLKEKVVRVLHNISFVDDPTRAFRAVRFAQRFGFKISKHTEKLIKNIKNINLKHLSKSRLKDEFINILNEDRSLNCLRSLKDLGLLELIDKEITLDEKTQEIYQKAQNNVIWHRHLFKDEKTMYWLVYFLVITMDLKKARINAITKKLNMTGKKKVRIIKKKEASLKSLKKIETKVKIKNSQVYFLLKDMETEDLLFILSLAKEKRTQKAITDFITTHREAKTILTGNDLKKLGIKNGSKIGETKTELLKRRLDNILKTKKDETDFVKKLIKKNGE